MQEQAELRKTEPEQKERQADGGTVDPCRQGCNYIRNLLPPTYHLLLIFFDRQQKTFKAVSRLGQIAAQKIRCIADEG